MKEEEVEEMSEIQVGDLVVCTRGRELGRKRPCTVVDVSESKKSFILEDSNGRCFRKYRHTIAKK